MQRLIALMVCLVSMFFGPRVCHSYEWATPMRVSPPELGGGPAKLAADRQEKVWCAWRSGYLKVCVSSFTDSTWSAPETVITYFHYGIDIAVDTNNYVWVIANNDNNTFYTFFNGTTWSEVDTVPYRGFFAWCDVDSSNLFWVFWSNGAPWEVFSCYYDGNSWSDTIRVSYLTGKDCAVVATTTDRNGKPWVYWDASSGGTLRYISYYDGRQWFHILVTGLQMNYEKGDLEAHPDGSLWLSSLAPGWVNPAGDTTYVRAVRYDTTGFSNVMLIQAICDGGVEYYCWPQLAVDSQGKVWCVWDVPVNGGHHCLFYSVWDSVSWSLPELIDTLPGSDPTITYEPLHDRIWVAWSSNREGYPAIYATYTKATGIEENTKQKNELDLNVTPNPCYKRTEIRYGVATASKVTIKIYNLLGELVYTFMERKPVIPGKYTIYWDNIDNNGNEVKNGIYFLQLEADGVTITKKLVLIK